MDLRKSFEEKLSKDNQQWCIYDSNWINYWNNKENYELINYKNEGFILYKIINKVECFIVFAYINSSVRKRGYLRQMINKLINKYQIIKLGSYDETTDYIWNRLGFNCYKKGDKNECNYFTNQQI